MANMIAPLADAPASAPTQSRHRVTIYFRDDALRQRSQDKLRQLLCCALNNAADASSTNARLARKALQYRKVWDRMANVDIASPQFDASEFMGVNWCRTQRSIEEHYERKTLICSSV